MKVLFNIIAVLSLMMSTQVLAHVGLKTSLPASNAMLMKSPEQLQLIYSGNVRVVKVTLKDKIGNKINFGFKPSKEAKKVFSWKLPKLNPSNYTVEWIVMGKDGHKMKGSYTFRMH
jgi:methionine-rich copper-binding protein CopC